jgi:hypothetical protein
MDTAGKSRTQPETEQHAQLDRIEGKLDEMLAFRDLILTTAGPLLSGGRSKVWLALLAKSRKPEQP